MPDTKVKPIAPVCADDTALDQALLDIDEKLHAWLDALGKANAILLDRHNWVMPAPTEIEPQDGPPPQDEAQPQDEALQHTSGRPSAAQPVAKPGAEALPDAQVVGEVIDEVLSKGAGPFETKGKLTPHQMEEALLQSLDTHTRQAIRIRRRLCNNKRSVRDLLEEYQAEQVQEQNQDQSSHSKRWWKKGNR